MKIETNQKSLRLIAALGCTFLAGTVARAQTAATKAESAKNTVDVTVTAERAEDAAAVQQPATKTVISAATLERQGAADMGQIVRYEPLVSAPKAATGSGNVWDGSGYIGYNIRGIEGNRVSLDIDGVPLPDAAPKPDGSTMNSFGVGRDYVEIENFQAVEINSGTSAAGRGSPGLGGSVAYVTKSPEFYLGRSDRPYYVGYKFGYTSVDNGFAHTITSAAKAGALQALVVYTHRDGEEADSKGSTPQNAVDWKSDSVLTKLVWNATNGHKFEVGVDYFKRDADIDAANKVSALYVGGIKQHSLSERFTLSATHTFVPTVTIPVFNSLTTKIYSQDAVSRDTTIAPNYVTGGIGYRRDLLTAFNNDSIGINSDAVKAIGTSQRLNYGVSASKTDSSRPWTEVRTRLSDNVVTQSGTKDRMPAMEATKFSAYASDKISLGSRVTLTPGVRFDYQKDTPEDLSRYVTSVPLAAQQIKKYSYDAVLPSLALSFAATENLEAYASYKAGARFPTPVEKTGTYDSFSYTGAGSGYAVLGNGNLKKETSDAFEVGLKGRAEHGLSFSVSAFYTKYKNYIEYAVQPLDPVNFPTIFLLYRPENLGDAEIYGAEASANVDFGAWSTGLTGFSAQLALGRANSSVTNNATGVKSSLASVGPFKSSLTLGYAAKSKRYGASLTGTYIDGKQAPADILTGGTVRFAVPSATLLDAVAYFNLTKNVSLNAGLYNITDKKYWDYYSARGLAVPTTAATLSEVERYVQPGVNGFISLSIGF